MTSTYVSPEEAREQTRYNANGSTNTMSEISVLGAEAEFAGLRQELSRISQRSRQSKLIRDEDVEKIGSGPDEDGIEKQQFNLEETLRMDQHEAETSGIKSKRIGVVWDGLTVTGRGGVTNFAKTFPDAFLDFFNIFGTVTKMFSRGDSGKDVNILQDFRGVVEPGEMVLVLGRPGSGCTTFLKVISNQRFGYSSILGDVQYGPLDAAAFSKQFRGEAVYNTEDDIHHPTLTVGQTLNFALDTKIPGQRPGGISKADFKEKVIKTLLRMFNIEHTRDTIVGNAMVRGVSGGERKRVSIAEMLVTGATVCCWDNSTRGLDASTALDYAKSLRIMTNINKTTTFVSLYQASENIYKQFDKVLVIDSGRQVYFGPTTSARAYFEDLGFKEKPRQTTPDYLTGCTDEFEREYTDGRSEKDSPHSPETLARAFLDSTFSHNLDEQMSIYKSRLENDAKTHDDFSTAVLQGKQKGSRAKSVYSVSYFAQIRALMKRQFLVKWQDKFSLSVAWVTSIVVAIVMGKQSQTLGLKLD